ncbi:hypothetical protein EDD17DRAFT_1512590 [Pisolithus thermaeus]|nr:hypothetical protein EV401DRAFT_1891279 [Pisolithus croceorrhizus]KAI6156264.1 hypothetical protein EDD17DRAFT_1512590 [Pisolithus thermaeus]
MADQIAATFQAFALVPSTVFGGLGGSNDSVVNLKARMDGLERTQGKILTEFETLKMQMARGDKNYRGGNWSKHESTDHGPCNEQWQVTTAFSMTRGEFERVTRERYESILKAYGQPFKGDTATKRDEIREFFASQRMASSRVSRMQGIAETR